MILDKKLNTDDNVNSDTC